MRKFGKDKPELMAFQIGDSEKVYTIPLAASMPASVLIEMGKVTNDETKLFEYQYGILRRYIGEAADELTAGDVRDIMNAWYEESAKQGAEVGE